MPRTFADFGCGLDALEQLVRQSEWGSVEQAVASLAVFASPAVIAEIGHGPVFRSIRGQPRGAIENERRIMRDDNFTPTKAFQWATGFSGREVQYNHLYGRADDQERYTAVANICVTPIFLAKLTDKHCASILRYRAYDSYGYEPDGALEMPPGYRDLDWAAPVGGPAVEARMIAKAAKSQNA